MLRILLLLTERLTERSNGSNDRDRNERKRNERPDNTPALRRSSVSLSELASIGCVDFAENKVVALYNTISTSPHQSTHRTRQSEDSQYPKHYKAPTSPQ